jgi:hypothetical protein
VPQPPLQHQPQQPGAYQISEQHQPPPKKEAFEKFKHQHPDYASSQANHAILKEKYVVAKEYSEHVTHARDKISMPFFLRLPHRFLVSFLSLKLFSSCCIYTNIFSFCSDGYIALIEQLRVERAMQGLVNKERGNDRDKDKKDLEEERTKALIEKEKAKYLYL